MAAVFVAYGLQIAMERQSSLSSGLDWLENVEIALRQKLRVRKNFPGLVIKSLFWLDTIVDSF